MFKRRVSIATFVAVIAAVAFGALGSGAAAVAATHAKKSTAAHGAAIRVGSICSCSGEEAAIFGGVGKVSTAWADSVNANGGINGHPVKLYLVDDGGNATTALQDVKTLVTKDHVIAIVGDDSDQDTVWGTYIASTGVPVVGGASFERPFLDNPDFFASGASLVTDAVGDLQLAKAAHQNKLGLMYCAEEPVCAQSIPVVGIGADLLGMTISNTEVSATAPSYTAPCLAMQGDSASAMTVVDNAAIVQRVVDACVQQGYKPMEVNGAGTAGATWLTDPNFAGIKLSAPDADYTDTAVPGVASFTAAINKYAPGLKGSSLFSYDTLDSWSAGLLFQAAAAAADIGPKSTPAEVKNGLYKLKNETLDGLSGPLNYVRGKSGFASGNDPCYFTMTIANQRFAPLNGGKETCLSSTVVSGLKKLLASAL